MRISQDDARKLLRSSRRELCISEVAELLSVDYRTAARNLMDLHKWKDADVRVDSHGKKQYKTRKVISK